MLGVIAHQVGTNDKAVDLITQALAIMLDLAEAHSNLGATLQDPGETGGGLGQLPQGARPRARYWSIQSQRVLAWN